MDKDVNLLLKKQADFEKQGNSLKLLRIVSVAFLVSLGISSIVLFFLSSRLSPSSIKRQEKTMLYNISFLHAKEAKLAMVLERTRGIESILSQRPDYNLTIGKILQVLPGGVTVQSLSVDKNSISISASSNSLLPIDGFINSLTDLAGRKDVVKDVTIDNIVLNGTNSAYSFSIKINLI